MLRGAVVGSSDSVRPHPGSLAEQAARVGIRHDRPLPRDLIPMRGEMADRPFSHPQWLFEPKMDGVRALAYLEGGDAYLVSRRGGDLGGRFPALADNLRAYQAHDLVLDGEIVALDSEGRSSFQLLQERLNLTGPSEVRRADERLPVHFYVFDILYTDGFDLRDASLDDRKSVLSQAVLETGCVHLLEYVLEHGEALYEDMVQKGSEGVMAKLRSSTYEANRRSRNWLKVKFTRTDDFVVAGYTSGHGARHGTFGSLTLGYYDREGRLQYAGNVGTGFDEEDLARLGKRLEGMRIESSPFAEEPDMKGRPATWVRPELVVRVKFSQWTRDGRLRAPVFMGVREEESPRDVVPAAVISPEQTVRTDTSANEHISSLLEQLKDAESGSTLEVEAHAVALTNLDKSLWPEADGQKGFTKRDFIAYLVRVSPWLLPHVRDRPLTLNRYPDGIDGEHFYQRHWQDTLPDFVHTVSLYTEDEGAYRDYLLCNNLATLVWLGQLADLELHCWFSRAATAGPDSSTSDQQELDRLTHFPDYMVFDLDPYIYAGDERPGEEPRLNRKGFKAACQVALRLKELLDGLHLPAFVKTSGRTGLHVLVPVACQYRYTAIRAAAGTLSTYLLKQHPDLVSLDWATGSRTGKVFIDFNQNVRGKSIVAPYSLRATPGMPVSAPLRWDELSEVYPTGFTPDRVMDRLSRLGDIWRDVLDHKSDLRALVTRSDH